MDVELRGDFIKGQIRFRENRVNQLINYKLKYLKTNKYGYYNSQKYDHILADGEEYMNLLEPFDDQKYINKLIGTGIKLHKGYAHLNSSQMMAINFFMPFLEEKKYLSLLSQSFDSLLNHNQRIHDVKLEVVSELESSVRGKTNIDAVLYSDDAKVFIEVKYTESMFESKNEAKYILKYNGVYKPIMEKMLKDGLIHQVVPYEVFMKDYQMYRMMCHVNARDRVVFLLPKGNVTINHSLNNITKYISSRYVSVIYLEDLMKELFKHIVTNQHSLFYYYKMFEFKYLGV